MALLMLRPILLMDHGDDDDRNSTVPSKLSFFQSIGIDSMRQGMVGDLSLRSKLSLQRLDANPTADQQFLSWSGKDRYREKRPRDSKTGGTGAGGLGGKEGDDWPGVVHVLVQTNTAAADFAEQHNFSQRKLQCLEYEYSIVLVNMRLMGARDLS
ncbi:hypothetical protein EYF80_017371 [Liparis tanakae]|uniref:Uncharacterized protein n=1 Tax=Liparis tanakae TaxID=230148 RepID=A0A4Z2I4R5_9TELE|nr:hypothetical protein EYF80_017371 [Liparis tanakae]